MIEVGSRFFSRWPSVILFGLALTVVAGPSSEAASSDRPGDRPTLSSALGGSWIGRYRCAQGWTGLELTITGLDRDRIEAEFSFFPLPENPRVPSGRFMMRGSFDARDNEAAAAQGHADAQFALGSWYWQGGARRNPATIDDERAVRWFRAAADRGHSRAQTNLGWAYVKGRGVAHDDAQGVAWFRKAAEANDPRAEEALAWAYERGRGVPRDLALSRSWNQRAASHGSESAARGTLAGQLRSLAIQTVGGADMLHAILGMRDDRSGAVVEPPRCDTTVGISCNAGVDLLGAQIFMSIK